MKLQNQNLQITKEEGGASYMKRFFFTSIVLLFIVPCYIPLFGQKINTSLTFSVFSAEKISNKTPVLIMLHGYGSNESDLFEMAQLFDKKFQVFSLRAPYNDRNNQGYSWYDLQMNTDGSKKHNYNEATESRKKILSFISNACKTYNLDSNNVFLIGFSQGSIMSLDIALNAPTKIKGILALSGLLLPETTANNKLDWTKINQVKFYIAHGRSDNVIKFTEAEKIKTLFKEKKHPAFDFNSYEMPHSICGQELNDIKNWLKKQLKK